MSSSPEENSEEVGGIIPVTSGTTIENNVIKGLLPKPEPSISHGLDFAAKLLRNHPELPEILSIQVGYTGGISLTPWMQGAPITALLRWSALLTKVSYSIAPLSPGSIINIHGFIDDVPVHLSGSTYQLLADDADVAAIRVAASTEEMYGAA